MSTLSEIQEAIEHLPVKEKQALLAWMISQMDRNMSPEEERDLLESLDRAANQLNAGMGVSIEDVRRLVRQKASK